jgi:hypothetical protein
MNAIKQRILALLSVLFLLLFSTQASAVLIDLNDFTDFSGGNVAISTDGLSAVFTEDETYSPVSLEHAGYLLPSDSTVLTFNYSLVAGLNDENYFDFYLGNLSAPIFSTNGTSASGTLSFDVSSYAASPLPMVFAFSAGWDDIGLDSILTISNLEIVQSGATVPEPGSFMLLSLGLLGMFFNFRRKLR